MKAAWIGAGATLGVGAVTVAVTLLPQAGGGASPAPGPSSQGTTSAVTAPADRPEAAPTKLPAAAEPASCRKNWQPVAGALVEIKPCIQRRPDGFTISTKVRASDPEAAPEQVTVWVWLMHLDQELMGAQAWDRTRDASAFHRCRLPLGGGEEIVTCSKDVEPWAGEAMYTTAASVRLADSAFPPGWDDPSTSGTQAVHALSWPG